MSQASFKVGLVVKAKAGRDAGKTFLIVGSVDDNHVLIADGATRRIEKPKLKKLKHLQPTKAYISNIAEKLSQGVRIFDSEIRKCLAKAMEEAVCEINDTTPPGEEG